MEVEIIMEPSIDEQLAAEVEKHELLYNAQHPSHHDRKATEMAWRSISSNQNMQEGDCKKRWKSLRDKYVREKKKKSSANKQVKRCKHWKLYNKLEFLDQFVKRPIEQKSYEETKTTGESKRSYTKRLLPQTSPDKVLNEVLEDLIKNGKHSTIDRVPTSAMLDSTSLKRSSIAPEQDPDADDLFFASIAAEVKKLPLRKRRKVKIEFQQTLQRIEDEPDS